jgi:hypothetical protein
VARSDARSVTVGAAGVPRVLVCLDGAGHVEHDGSASAAGRGDVLLLPAALGPCVFRPTGTVTVLEVGLPEVRCVRRRAGWTASMKRLIVFDLDGTLAKSKAALDAEMSSLMHALLGIVRVAVISGGAWKQFEAQVLAHLPPDERLMKLSLLPTCGTKFFAYEGAWKELYSEDLSADEKAKIIDALKQSFAEAGFKVERTWGDTIEDRGSHVTLSALGQQAPLEAKALWDPDFAKRKKIKAILDARIPEFSVRLGGKTSIDVTKHGIDKAYGLRKLRDLLGVPLAEMLFVGDALFVRGNDHPAREAGVPSIQVRDPDETKRVIETLLACLERPDGARGHENG